MLENICLEIIYYLYGDLIKLLSKKDIVSENIEYIMVFRTIIIFVV